MFGGFPLYTLNSVMSLKPRGMDVRSADLTSYCHISLPYITKFIFNANHQRSQPTFALHHVSICEVSPYSYSSFYVTCWMLVHAYVTSPGKVKWSGPHHTIKMLHFVLFHNVTCCTSPIVSDIHVNSTKLRNITCTLVATDVILQI
jgi:hypothetical protein